MKKIESLIKSNRGSEILQVILIAGISTCNHIILSSNEKPFYRYDGYNI